MIRVKFISLKHINPFKGSLTSLLAVCILLLSSASGLNKAYGSVVDWSSAVDLQAIGGVENPLVKFGFTPQPEPPGHTGPRLDLTDPTIPVLMVSTEGVSDFRILFALADLGNLTINAPGVPDLSGHFEFEVLFATTGAKACDVFFDITTSSGGVPDRSSWVGFNPQPEPPAFPSGAGTIGFDFTFTNLSEATLSMQVLDSEGNRFSFVPEPATLFLLGLGGLALLRNRRT